MYTNDLFEIPNRRCDLKYADFTMPRNETVKSVEYGKQDLFGLNCKEKKPLRGNIDNFRNCIRQKHAESL